MARESKTKYAVLGMLNLSPKCGYDIKKELERDSLFFWNESYGQIYPMLKQLMREEMTTCEVVERQDQPDMKIYTITEAGREELARWLRQPAEQYPVRNELLLKMLFGASSSRDMNVAHLERLRDQMHDQRTRFDHEREQLSEELAGDDRTFWLLTLRYGEVINQAVQDWCDEAIETLSERGG